MNISDSVAELFKQGVGQITIGMSPNKTVFIQIQHSIKTGPSGNLQNIAHQIEGESFAVCLDKAKRQVAHTNELKVENMLVVPTGRN